MKRLTILFAGILITTLVYAEPWKSRPETKNETGIAFHKGTWDEALLLAKKEARPIFLDIYASWCGPCKMLKARTFPDEEVGEFYNANFINVAVDGEKGEGVELARKYKIQGYPSLIYLDANGQLIAKTAGYRNPKQLIDIGKQIIQK